MTGRPSSFTPELADHICACLAEGRSMRSVCRDEGMPDLSTVFRWLRTNDGFREQYARATEERGEALADEIVDIADMPPAYKTTAEGTSIDPADVANRKLQIDTRKWVASKLKPKKYGDQVEHKHTGNVALGLVIHEKPKPAPEPALIEHEAANG